MKFSQTTFQTDSWFVFPLFFFFCWCCTIELCMSWHMGRKEKNRGIDERGERERCRGTEGEIKKEGKSWEATCQ